MNAQALMNSFGYCQLHDVVNKTEGYSLKFPKSISISGCVISTAAKHGLFAEIGDILRSQGIVENANKYFAIRKEIVDAWGRNCVESIVSEHLGYPINVVPNIVLGGNNKRRFLLFLY